MALSLTLQTLAVLALLIVPPLHVAALQTPPMVTMWMPLQVPPPAVKTARARPVSITLPPVRRGFFARIGVPAYIDITPDIGVPEMAPVLPGSGQSGPLLALRVGSLIQPPAPVQPAVVKLPTPRPTEPVRVSLGAQAARLTYNPKPAYPPLARAARVHGSVKLQAVIAIDGAIKDLRLISGPPLLVAAATGAVKQWRYQPMLLNGTPVEVATGIEVNFMLH